ncbi:bicarbonate-binding protein, partial [Fischerella thermalis CCMEE 5273]
MTKFSRRKFLVTTSAAALLTQTISHRATSGSTFTQLNSGVYAGYSNSPEVTKATLGFIPVTSGCPLIIAKAKGFFAKYGMPDVQVLKQPSWAVMRDKLMLGSGDGGLDGSHLLFPMAYLIATGEISYGRKIPMYILARLNVNGQGISLANAYKNLNLGLDGFTLKSVLA